MHARIPLVLGTSGQEEQLPVGDYIPANIGSPNIVFVTSNAVNYIETHMVVDATSNQKVRTINGGSANDLLYIRGTLNMNKVEFEPDKPGGNISSKKKRKIENPNQVLVLLNLGNTWTEVSWVD